MPFLPNPYWPSPHQVRETGRGSPDPRPAHRITRHEKDSISDQSTPRARGHTGLPVRPAPGGAPLRPGPGALHRRLFRLRRQLVPGRGQLCRRTGARPATGGDDRPRAHRGVPRCAPHLCSGWVPPGRGRPAPRLRAVPRALRPLAAPALFSPPGRRHVLLLSRHHRPQAGRGGPAGQRGALPFAGGGHQRPHLGGGQPGPLHLSQPEMGGNVRSSGGTLSRPLATRAAARRLRRRDPPAGRGNPRQPPTVLRTGGAAGAPRRAPAHHRGQRRAGVWRGRRVPGAARHQPGRERTQAHRGGTAAAAAPAPAQPEAGIHRPPGQRGGARFQQHAEHHPRLRGDRPGQGGPRLLAAR